MLQTSGTFGNRDGLSISSFPPSRVLNRLSFNALATSLIRFVPVLVTPTLVPMMRGEPLFFGGTHFLPFRPPLTSKSMLFQKSRRPTPASFFAMSFRNPGESIGKTPPLRATGLWRCVRPFSILFSTPPRGSGKASPRCLTASARLSEQGSWL